MPKPSAESDCLCQYEDACCCKMPQYDNEAPCPCLAAREAEVERLRLDMLGELAAVQERDEALAALKAENAALRELAHDAACCGVEFDDARLGYVTVQMDRETWEQLQALYRARAALGEKGEK